jgi:hypothetical protein
MTSNQQRFITLEKKKAEVKLYLEELAAATESLVKEMGLNSYFQDEEGTVYKLVKPEGRFVKYEEYSYIRTRRAGEKRGDLSLKEAEEAGYSVPSK